MTQDEIKKALECCAKSYGDDVHCTDCPYDTLTPRACCERFCQDVLCRDALNLITEQEKEIEQLKANINQSQDRILETAQTNQEYREQQVKQAKIDILNRVMTYINNKIENDYGDMSDSVQYLTINIDDFDDFIDELMAEVQNGEDKG